MNALALIAAAAAAWWFYRNRMPDGGLPGLPPALGGPPADAATPSPVVSGVFTLNGRSYRVVGDARADGLIPVMYLPPPGMMAPQVIQYYDPATQSINYGPGVGFAG